MGVKAGIAKKIQVNTTPQATATWVDLPQQTSGSFSVEPATENANHKGNNGYTVAVEVSKSWSASAGGYVDEDNAALLFLLDTSILASGLSSEVEIRITNDDGDTFEGLAIASYEENFDDGAIISYSVTFTGNGALTVTRA